MDSPTATDCNAPRLRCATPDGVRPRRFEADFTGGALTADGGALLMGLANQSVGLFRRVAACFSDHRDAAYVVHEVETLVGQRILGLTLGYEDLNDHDALRKDPLLGAVLGRLEKRRDDCEPLAGKSTLNRLELAAARLDRKHRKVVADFGRFDALLAELFAERFRTPPKELVLDLDATDVPLHGGQEGRFYHGYYRGVLLPAAVGVLRRRAAARAAAQRRRRRGRRRRARLGRAGGPAARALAGRAPDPAHGLGLLPGGDPGVVRRPGGRRLRDRAGQERAAEADDRGRIGGRPAERARDRRGRAALRGLPVRHARLLDARAAGGRQGGGAARHRRRRREGQSALRRHVAAGRDASGASALRGVLLRPRRRREPRQGAQARLFSARCSCNLFDANTLRLYFSTFALILFNRLRDALARTADKLASAYPGTLRLRLLKIGARVRVSARRIHVAMAGGCPDKAAFAAAWRALVPT